MNNTLWSTNDFFLGSAVAFALLDDQGKIRQINPAWEEQLGQTDVEFLTAIHPDDRACAQQHYQQLQQALQTTTQFNARWQNPQGEYRWYLWTINLAPDHSAFYVVACDITPQKNAELALKDSEERFQLAIRGANHGLWDWNLKTNAVYFSPRWKGLLGYTEQEIPNHLDALLEYVHPDDFMDMWGTLEAYLDKHIDKYESLYRMRHHDGHYIWVLAQAAALWDEDDEPYRMVGTYVDVTHYKRLEQALQEREKLLTAIFNVTPVGLCVIDEVGKFIRVNQAYCDLYGYKEEELVGRPFTKVLAAKERQKALEAHQKFMAGETEIAREGQIRNRIGEILDVEMTFGRIEQPNGTRFKVTTITDVTHRKRTEAERHRLFHFSVDMQSIADFTGYFKELNAAWEKTLGWKKSELLHQNFLNFIHTADKQTTLDCLQRLKKGKTILNFSNRFLCKNGTHKWLSWNIYPLVDQNTLYAITRDITESKWAEQKIEEQQEFIQLLLETLPNLIFIKDRAGNFVFVNKAYAELIGTDIDTLINLNKTELSHPLENLEHQPNSELQVIELNQVVTTEENCIDASGEQRWFQMIKKPFIQKDHAPLVLSVGTDITARKQNEEALRQSEARYRAIIQDQSELICRFLPNLKLSFVNEAYCRYFHKSEGALLGHFFVSFIFAEDQATFIRHLHHLTLENPTMTCEHRVILPDGQIRWLQWNNRAMYDDQGNIIEYQAVGRDITKRKQAEEKLRESEERLKIITSNAPVILFALDTETHFTFSRGKALNIIGLQDDEALGQSALKMCYQLNIPEHIKYIKQALSGKTVSSIVKINNAVLETRYTPLFGESNHIIGVIGVAVDISERHRLEVQYREAIAELETILDNSLIGIAYVKKGCFIRVNTKLENLLGHLPGELGGQSMGIIFPSEQAYQQILRQVAPLFQQGKGYDGQQLIQTKQGNTFWSRIVGKAVDSKDLERGTIWMIEDITLQKQAEQNLRLTATIFETTADAILVTDLHNRIQKVNPAFTKITGYTMEEVYGEPVSKLSSGRHDMRFYEKMWKQIKETGHWQGEIWNRKKEGEIYVAWLSISVISDEQGEPQYYMAILSDISRLQEDLENIRYLANYDSLTNLPNRLLFHDNLLQAQIWARRHNRMFALLFIDLDGFKPVNDELGHAVGDQLLQGVAQRLLNCVRETDTVARLGGDEFIAILGEINQAKYAANIANKIIQTLQKVFMLGELEINISASIGITLYPSDSEDVDVLLKMADKAMYAAKRKGKGQYCFFHEIG